MSAQPILLFQLLANGKLEPGALLLQLPEDDDPALLDIVSDQGFKTLCNSIPCLLEDSLSSRLSPALSQALRDAGCQITPQSAFHVPTAAVRPVAPPHCEWLCGDWYLEPPEKRSAGQTASHDLSLRLLQLVSTDADTCEIEAVFRRDPVLAYHLLRLVNSPGIGVGKQISSFAQAILILGRHQLKRWLNLMLFAANRDDYRTAMLLARVTLRARSMELLAKAGGFDRTEQDQAFMAGMFSLFGSLFGKPLKDILGPLKLNETLGNAVLTHEGKLGRLLAATQKLEQGDETGLGELFGDYSIAPADYNLIAIDAHQWMLGAIHDKPGNDDA